MKKILPIAVASIVMAFSSPAFAQISMQKAVSIAKKTAGGGVVTDVDYKGRYYDIDIEKRNGKKHEIKVNTKTGKIIAHHVEWDD